MRDLRNDALEIIQTSINAVLPDKAVRQELEKRKETITQTSGKVVVLAIGKAAWNMASAAHDVLKERIDKGIVITKYGHLKEPLENFEFYEAGHPILDGNTIFATEKAIEMVESLTEKDFVLFLISGGGSALFEKPLDGLELPDIMSVSDQLIASGASIDEINAVRKHMSAVKGGRFAKLCGKGQTPILSVLLSDVLGGRVDTIASGPSVGDITTSKQAVDILEKYNIYAGTHIYKSIEIETEMHARNNEIAVIGSVEHLCKAAAEQAENLGYKPQVLSAQMDCEAREFGKVLASIAKEQAGNKGAKYTLNRPAALIFGGETVVRVTGTGQGGRCQEIALSAALKIEGIEGVLIFAVGSDGTDGPTDAAGALIDGDSVTIMREEGIDPNACLENNNAYQALKASGDLVVTGPTGTNVNDLMVILID